MRLLHLLSRRAGLLPGNEPSGAAPTTAGEAAGAGAKHALRMVRRAAGDGYVSEFTRFMEQFMAQHPEVIDDRRRGRDIFWDKRVDFAELEQARRDSVPVDSYYYFGNPWPRTVENRPQESSTSEGSAQTT